MVARNDPFWTIKELDAANGGRYEHFILLVAFLIEGSLKCKNNDYDDESSDLSPDRMANNFFFRDVKLREDLPEKNSLYLSIAQIWGEGDPLPLPKLYISQDV